MCIRDSNKAAGLSLSFGTRQGVCLRICVEASEGCRVGGLCPGFKALPCLLRRLTLLFEFQEKTKRSQVEKASTNAVSYTHLDVYKRQALSNVRPYGSTFLIFSDYMKMPIRLSSIMEVPSIRCV